jgi:two-component sensor histidine kinase
VFDRIFRVWLSFANAAAKPSLQAVLSVAFSAFALAVALSAAVVVRLETENQLRTIVHRELQQNARQAADRVSTWMFERRVDAQLIATTIGTYDERNLSSPNLDELVRVYPESILWVGFVDRHCIVRQGSGGQFVGDLRGNRECTAGQAGPNRSYIHQDNRLQHEVDQRIITITNPVPGGGYVAIDIRVKYFEKILYAVPIAVAEGHPIDAYIISKNTRQIVTGTVAIGKPMPEDFMQQVGDPQTDIDAVWPDGTGFMSASAPTHAIGGLPDANFLVVTRTVEDDAMTLVESFVSRMVIWGVMICATSLAIGLFTARKIGAPLRRLTDLSRAAELREIGGASAGYSEIEELQRALVKRFADLQEAEARASKDAIEREALLKEVHHRVKNNLQVIISLMRLQSTRVRGQVDGRFILNRLTNRVQVLGWLYSKLYERAIFDDIDTQEIIDPLIQLISDTYPGEATINRNIGTVRLGFDQTLVLGMLVIEIVTNAVVHTGGTVDVTLKTIGDRHALTVTDTGTGFDPDQKSAGIGITLSQRMATQLGGSLNVTTTNSGSVVEVIFSAS